MGTRSLTKLRGARGSGEEAYFFFRLNFSSWGKDMDSVMAAMHPVEFRGYATSNDG